MIRSRSSGSYQEKGVSCDASHASSFTCLASLAPRGKTALMPPLQQPILSKRQNIGIRTQWMKLYTGCGREGEKHYSPSEGEEKAEGEVRPPAGAI